MSEERINQMEQLENEISQFHKDKTYTPTFFFRKNKTFPDGFAPIRQIVNYAKDKYNFNYFTFHTRALQSLRDKIGQKSLRYKFVQFGYVPDKTNFSKYVNGLLPVPQKMQFDVEYLTTKILNAKERLDLLTFQKLEDVEKLCEETKKTDELRMNVLSDRLEEYRRSSREDHQRLADHNANKRTDSVKEILDRIDSMEKAIHQRVNDQTKRINALENWRYYMMGVGFVIILLVARINWPSLFG